MKSAITICLIPQARSGPFVFHDGLEDGCKRAAALGFDAIEIFPPSANAVDIADLQSLLDHHRLKVAAIGSGGGWILHKWSLTSPDATVRTQAREFIRAIIDLAEGFGAPAIIGSMQGRVEEGVTREEALNWLAEALGDLGGHAMQRGQHLLYEALNRYETNLFNRQAEAAEWLRSNKAVGVKLLCDLFHMNIEEADLAGVLRECGDLVGHVHFADSNRRAMGLGHTSAGAVVSALRDIGYQGYLSAEIFPFPDSETAARQTIQTIQALAQSC